MTAGNTIGSSGRLNERGSQMSMLKEFYVFLVDQFQNGEGPLDPKEIEAKLEEGGFSDVTAYDVREAVNLMYEEGDVFESNQSSVLEAYTGGNQVDQSFNGSNIGQAATTGNASSSASNTGASAGSSGGGAAAPAPAAPPPPPPMDPMAGASELDAAVQQIVYVSNITNNNTTNNTTTIDDRDTFEDNDTVVDSSVNQTILANGDVNQDFDTTTGDGNIVDSEGSAIAGDEGIAVAGNVADANLVTGDNDGVIADDITDSNVIVGDGNETTSMVDSDGSAIGDGNVTGDNNVVGDNNDGNVVGENNDNNNVGENIADGEGAFVGDGNATGDQSFVGDGNAVGEGNNSGDGNAFGDGSVAGDGNTVVNLDGINEGVLNMGDGDVEAIQDSTVGAASFGDGDATNTVDSNNTTDSGNTTTTTTTTTTDNSETTDNSIDATVAGDFEADLVDIDDSPISESAVGIAEVEIEVALPEEVSEEAAMDS